MSTQGNINFPTDYSGKWIILFSHPADFTPLCTSEFMTFASMQDEFTAINTQLVGLSIDGLYSHIAWLRAIKEKIEFKGMKNVDITFPLIEDITSIVLNTLYIETSSNRRVKKWRKTRYFSAWLSSLHWQ